MPTAAAPPPHEADRIATLHRLEILDTLPEKAYDDLTLLASQVCGTPIAIFALIARDRQWYKATVGTDLTETDRNVAFCAHAILEPDRIFTVEDASVDPRFIDNPFVTGEPHIRFYAGAPIVMPNGDAIGTICVIDPQPRRLTDAQRECLSALARQASLLLDLREKAIAAERIARTHETMTVEARLKQKRGMELLELVLRGGQMGLWDLDVATGRWTVNAREQLMLGYADADLAGDTIDWRTLIHPDDWPVLDAAMEPHLKGRAAYYECTHRMRHADGHFIWVLDRGVIVERDVRGEATRLVGTHVDVTESRAREEARKRDAERLELALASGDQGLWDWNVVTDEIIRSTELQKMLGYSLGDIARFEANGEFRASVLPPEDHERYKTAMDLHLRGLTPMFDVEIRVRHARGHLIWIHDRGKVVERDADGQALRVVGTATNITARKQAEQQLGDSERRLRLVTDSLPALIAHVDADERYTFANKAVGQVFGMQSQTLIGKTMREMREIRQEKSYDAIAPYVVKALQGKRVVFEDFVEVRGRPFFYQTHYVPDVDQAGVVNGFYAMTFDITERKRAELRRAESEERLRGITDSLPVMIAEIDTRGRFRFVNETYRTWLGVDPAAIIGAHLADAISPEYYEGRREQLEQARRGLKVSFEQSITLPSGVRCLQTTYLPHFDAAGSLTGIYALTSDITALKETQEQLDTLARFDSLTGLANRRQFAEKLTEAMARTRRSSKPMAVLYLDIDRFKAINDSLGHAAGDAVLIEFARRLKLAVREVDLVARHAGDEFVVVLEGIANDAEARAVGEKLVATMRPPFTVLGATVDVTTSVGVATFGGGPLEVAALLALADRALYDAKSSGRDCVILAVH